MPILSSILISGSMMMPTQAMPNLQNTEWRLEAPAQAAPLPTLNIADSRISGFAGCNRFTLGIDDDGKHQVSATRKLCAPEVMQREQALLALLAAPFRLLPVEDGKHLSLMAGKTRYRFARQPAQSAAAEPPAAVAAAPLPAPGEQYWYVASRPCAAAAGPSTCLRLRSREDQPWRNYAGSIAGFEPEAGSRYYLKLQGVPAADGQPGLQLMKVVYRETVTPLAD
ncbi:META and DUF4377 domain-containing protein [Chromobacterium sphagni]|uniref:DUF306 domain-containing protein n=1 Tax=Chromobacterium sphagni TaxID=1903179 RepID=A0A1S1X1I2_9NEIS|nr:META and DUF4377 domain-containing protein [Chromobacterium sphagni]OHX13403.1 hypothetical protein BI347_07660 [Chromobacterium sphagni]OHX21861.1 hypothetical protein BI344_04970 [Chromobacterium sphagni]